MFDAPALTLGGCGSSAPQCPSEAPQCPLGTSGVSLGPCRSVICHPCWFFYGSTGVQSNSSSYYWRDSVQTLLETCFLMCCWFPFSSFKPKVCQKDTHSKRFPVILEVQVEMWKWWFRWSEANIFMVGGGSQKPQNPSKKTVRKWFEKWFQETQKDEQIENIGNIWKYMRKHKNTQEYTKTY